jgi:hypothetical protein
LKEVAHEFGGRIPRGGGDRASGSVGTRWVVSIFLFFVVARCVQVSREFVTDTTPQHTITTMRNTKNTNTMIYSTRWLPAALIF